MRFSSLSTPIQESALVIEPGRTEKKYWADLWRYRELFLILAWRDISVRYKQTIIGIAWAILRPFLTMVVFTVIFGWRRRTQQYCNGSAVKFNTEGAEKTLCASGIFLLCNWWVNKGKVLKLSTTVDRLKAISEDEERFLSFWQPKNRTAGDR
jgi:hypothetical protein